MLTNTGSGLTLFKRAVHQILYKINSIVALRISVLSAMLNDIFRKRVIQNGVCIF